jgi:hypothetical protein
MLLHFTLGEEQARMLSNYGNKYLYFTKTTANFIQIFVHPTKRPFLKINIGPMVKMLVSLTTLNG